MLRKNKTLNSASHWYCRGVTLLEACLAFLLVMVSALGCLSALQMAIKMRRSIEHKTWALTEMESLADKLRRIKTPHAFFDLLTSTKIRLEKALPGSHLSWVPEPTERVYQIGFVWGLGERQHIKFIVMPVDFH